MRLCRVVDLAQQFASTIQTISLADRVGKPERRNRCDCGEAAKVTAQRLRTRSFDPGRGDHGQRRLVIEALDTSWAVVMVHQHHGTNWSPANAEHVGLDHHPPTPVAGQRGRSAIEPTRLVGSNRGRLWEAERLIRSAAATNDGGIVGVNLPSAVERRREAGRLSAPGRTGNKDHVAPVADGCGMHQQGLVSLEPPRERAEQQLSEGTASLVAGGDLSDDDPARCCPRDASVAVDQCEPLAHLPSLNRPIDHRWFARRGNNGLAAELHSESLRVVGDLQRSEELRQLASIERIRGEQLDGLVAEGEPATIEGTIMTHGTMIGATTVAARAT